MNKDDTRCAICGWPLGNCKPGDCSMRPFPRRYYDADRARREYAPMEIPAEAPLSYEEKHIANLISQRDRALAAVEKLREALEPFAEADCEDEKYSDEDDPQLLSCEEYGRPRAEWCAVCNAKEALAATELASVELCTWTEEGDGIEGSGNWFASCGDAWTLLEGTPEENHYRHCPGCGKLIKQVPFVYKDEEDEDSATVELPKCDHCGAIGCGTDCDGSSHYTPEKKE